MYRTDPKRRQAKRWHALLNNGYHWVLISSTGEIAEKAHALHELRYVRQLRPDLQLVNVDTALAEENPL